MLKKIKHKIAEKITEQSQMPENQIAKVIYLEITDNNYIKAENCNDILCYNENSVILKFNDKTVTINGFDIEIPMFTQNSTELYGNFTSIELGGKT